MAFKGKTAIITGGLNGIGYATANCLLQNEILGLAILDIAVCDAKVVSLQTKYTNSKIAYYPVDVGDIASVDRVFRDVLSEFSQIDILVNSAGIINENDAEQCLRVNLLGVINVCQTALKSMTKAINGNSGIIVNISSLLGVGIKPGLPVYCASKHGVTAFTRTMAKGPYFEKYGVKFITICPGKTNTTMIDQLWKTLQENGQSNSIDVPLNHERPIQSADDCAKCIIKIIASGENGSTWSIKVGKWNESHWHMIVIA